MTNPIARDPMYRRRSFDADIIEGPLVHHLPAELSRSRGNDGGAWCRDLAHNDSAVGHSVCPRVREAVESTCTPHRLVLAGRRNVRFDPR